MYIFSIKCDEVMQFALRLRALADVISCLLLPKDAVLTLHLLVCQAHPAVTVYFPLGEQPGLISSQWFHYYYP